MAGISPQPSASYVEAAAGIYVLRAFSADEAAAIVRDAAGSPAWLPAGINAELAVDTAVRDADVLYEDLNRAASAAYRERLFLVTNRLARALVPEAALSELQVVRYHPGGRYVDHRDSPAKGATARALSLVCYLNDDFRGGATVFPDLPHTVRPSAGIVIAFPPEYLHRGEAVAEGTKYVLTAWYNHTGAG